MLNLVLDFFIPLEKLNEEMSASDYSEFMSEPSLILEKIPGPLD